MWQFLPHLAAVDGEPSTPWKANRKALGASPHLIRELVETALLNNPAGNGDEQTPLVILAWRGMGPNPLVRVA